MKITIRSKLILAISSLIIVIFVIAAYLFVNEKKREIAEDIYVNALAFSRLTSTTIADDYDLYLKQNSFVYFNRDIQSIFQQNDDVSQIKVLSYKGEILYDSGLDVDKKYEGERRIVAENLLTQIQSEYIAVQDLDGNGYFLRFRADGGYEYVSPDERLLQPIKQGTLIEYLLVPANEKYSVLYKLDYQNMIDRVAAMQQRIIYLAVFAIMLGAAMSFGMSFQITKPVAELVKGAAEISKGNFHNIVEIKTHDELKFLGDAFNKMAVDLEKSVETKVYKERVTRELELAAQIQDQLIPDQAQIPPMPGIELAAWLDPAEEIGGDIYDFLKVNDDNLVMYLGDVTGHGVPAGIISSISSALFYGYSIEPDLKKILLDVNRVLKAKTMPTMFLTLCLMNWDAKNQKFTYASAGHEKILHYHAETKKADYAAAGGIALGMMKDISKSINVCEIETKPGDYLVIYSDGIPECWKNEKELYGFERLQAALEKFVSLDSPEAVMKAILEDVKTFAEGHKQMDDITIMVIKRV